MTGLEEEKKGEVCKMNELVWIALIQLRKGYAYDFFGPFETREAAEEFAKSKNPVGWQTSTLRKPE